MRRLFVSTCLGVVACGLGTIWGAGPVHSGEPVSPLAFVGTTGKTSSCSSIGTETSSPRRRHPPAQYVCLDGDIVLPRIEAAAEEEARPLCKLSEIARTPSAYSRSSLSCRSVRTSAACQDNRQLISKFSLDIVVQLAEPMMQHILKLINEW